MVDYPFMADLKLFLCLKETHPVHLHVDITTDVMTVKCFHALTF